MAYPDCNGCEADMREDLLKVGSGSIAAGRQWCNERQ